MATTDHPDTGFTHPSTHPDAGYRATLPPKESDSVLREGGWDLHPASCIRAGGWAKHQTRRGDGGLARKEVSRRIFSSLISLSYTGR
jgi:hypothetical protein